MASYLQGEIQSVSLISCDVNSTVGLCHRHCVFFSRPFDGTRPDKTRHSQLKPVVCCHTYSQSLFMECDQQLYRDCEKECGHNLTIKQTEKNMLPSDQSKTELIARKGFTAKLNEYAARLINLQIASIAMCLFAKMKESDLIWVCVSITNCVYIHLNDNSVL